MDAFRLSAAGGALALHGLVLTGVLALAVAPPAKRETEPVQVVLVTPPEPLPFAPPAVEPRPAETAARPEPPAVTAPPESPAAGRTTPRPARTRPRAPQPDPQPLVRPSAPEPAPTAPPPRETVARIAEPVSPAASVPTPLPPPQAAVAAEPARAAGAHVAAAPATRSDARASATPVRSAPRIDASWSGNTPPPYPGMARRMGDEGEVRLDVHVGADGRVTDIRLRQSSGSALLDRTAIDTVRKWRFKPATVDGQPVAEWYHDWRWVFRLEG